MAFSSAEKAQVIKNYGRAQNDTGSPEVQIALLSTRIDYLTAHLKDNAHDFHTRYGLGKLVSQRRRLMQYLKRINPAKYREIIQKLGMRG
jgi:small subunit ribosomal protein S15